MRDDLMFTLFKAGFSVLPTEPAEENESIIKQKVLQHLSLCRCSIHIVGPEPGTKLQTENGKSLIQWQFEQARLAAQNNQGFKIFIWQPFGSGDSSESQEDFLLSLQHDIEANMTYTSIPSAIQLADDIRSVLEVSEKPDLQLSKTEVFFISNMVDEPTANEITDMLSDVVELEKVSIEANSDLDYYELTSQQMQNSKLAVVYFKESSDWAIPFAQQIWKKIGGASAPTPILVIGDEDPDVNREKKFSAPKVVSVIVSGELIPLEIKVQYDKLAGA
jgi:hypothetical protein